jgi:ABC-type branched-subunit amino acid transport system permease subunit
MGDAPGINLVVYGIVLILMVTFLPSGIIGVFRRGARRA